MSETRYDRIGVGYSNTRREDPRLARAINEALGSGHSLVNVGAGPGSYEPEDRYVLAIEPSDEMARQRPPSRVPAIRGNAGQLPLRSNSVDAALAVMTVHHWDGAREAGVAELRRVARGQVVIVSVDASVSAQMWLMADYLPEVAELDYETFPTMEQFRRWLGPDTKIDTIPIPRGMVDWMILSFWAHPERVLDPAARAGTSGFARMPKGVVDRAVCAVQGDLASGLWDSRHGHLRKLPELDVGLRLIVAPGADR